MTDARRCPTCGARGILPLNQPRDERGRIVDPIMLCPSCEVEFRAVGVTWLGAFPVSPHTTKERLSEIADELAARMSATKETPEDGELPPAR